MIEELKPENIMDQIECMQQHAIEAKLTGDRKIDPTYLAQNLKQVMIASGSKILVYYVGRKIVGYVIGNLLEQFWSGKVYGHIDLLYMHEGYRNRDTAGELYKAIESWFEQNGAEWIVAGVHHFDNECKPIEAYNKRAVTFFETQNYHQTGVSMVKKL